jgi:BlaI family penicillinase repressor
MRLTDTEWVVMNALWERSPASVRDVLERVEGETGWAYTTVKTLLERLAEKGAVRVRKRANAGLFEPVLTRPQARRSALRSLLDRAFDGTFGGLLQHLIAEERLSERDRKKLADLLDELDRDRGG